jgi:prophage regulatory protein
MIFSRNLLIKQPYYLTSACFYSFNSECSGQIGFCAYTPLTMFHSFPRRRNMAEVLQKLHDVKKATALSRSSIYLKIAEGTFPRPVKLGARAVAWRSSDIQRWIDERPETRPSSQGGVF